jgi:glycerol-3-phosphate dehydrogenase
VRVSESGLLTIAGGKWTTYRKMAEDVVTAAETLGDLAGGPCVTETLNIHGYHQHADEFGRLAVYGSDARLVEELIRDQPELGEPIHTDLELTRGEVVWACREEMARTVDDVLARRSRSLLFDARAARDAAAAVAELMAAELVRDAAWVADQVSAFDEIAQGYIWDA